MNDGQRELALAFIGILVCLAIAALLFVNLGCSASTPC